MNTITNIYLFQNRSKLSSMTSREIVLHCNSHKSSSNSVKLSLTICFIVLFMNLLSSSKVNLM